MNISNYMAVSIGLSDANYSLLKEALKSFKFDLVNYSSYSEGLPEIKLNYKRIVLLFIDHALPSLNAFDIRFSLLEQHLDIPTIVRLEGVVKFEDMDLIISLRISRVISEYNLSDLKLSIQRYNRQEDLEMDEEIRQAWVEESQELLEEAEQLILDLENDFNDEETIAKLFRVVHTIKGSSNVVDWKQFGSYTHAYEDLLTKIRSGETEMSSALCANLVNGFDRIKSMIIAISKSEEFDFNLRDWVRDLSNISDSAPKSQATTVSNVSPIRTIRVPIDSLSKLSYYVALLTESQRGLLSSIKSLNTANVAEKMSEIGIISEELQVLEKSLIEKLDDVRCVPMKSVYRPFPRLVRDLAQDLGKSVSLELIGEDVRVESTIASVLTNTLVHLLRNSMDHGLESPAVRQSKGKEESGRLRIATVKNGKSIQVTVEDDGRGLDLSKIARKAVVSGLYSEEEISKKTEEDIANIIFERGFSTADAVSNVSGRGVGMDAVKESALSVGGNLSVKSITDQGTTFTLYFDASQSVMFF